MLSKLLLPLVLTVGTSIISLPTVVHATPFFNLPDIIAREDIPAGIPVHEYDATAAALWEPSAGEEVQVALLDGWSNCKGSLLCSSTNGGACTSASNVRDTKGKTRTYIDTIGKSFFFFHFYFGRFQEVLEFGFLEADPYPDSVCPGIAI